MELHDFINRWYRECGQDDEWSKRVVPLGHRMYGFNAKKLYRLLKHEYRKQLYFERKLEEFDRAMN
jgi:hypothetical protein